MYILNMDCYGSSDSVELDDANEIESIIDDWVKDGEWGDGGAEIETYWSLENNDGKKIDSGSHITIIDPNHERLIKDACRWSSNYCGDNPDDHEWTSEGEGGCDENPGVWSTGGTSMVFKSHCEKCGLRRTEYTTGYQKNPGEHDTVEYEMPE